MFGCSGMGLLWMGLGVCGFVAGVLVVSIRSACAGVCFGWALMSFCVSSLTMEVEYSVGMRYRVYEVLS